MSQPAHLNPSYVRTAKGLKRPPVNCRTGCHLHLHGISAKGIAAIPEPPIQPRGKAGVRRA